MKIPMINGTPKITTNMKAQCIGEFTFTITEPCPKCACHLDDHYDDIMCMCNNSEEAIYEREIVVPWDVCKDIYKKMVMIAGEDNE